MKTFKILSFNHAEQQLLWDTVCQQLIKAEDQIGECLIIANNTFDGMLVDSLVVCSKGIFLLSLMGLHGTIVVSEKEPWKAGSRQVTTGGLARTPFHQIMQQCGAVSQYISKYTQTNVGQHIKACVILNNDTTLSNQISAQNQQWFSVVRIDDFVDYLKASPVLDTDTVEQVRNKLEQLMGSMAASVEVWQMANERLNENTAAFYEQLETLCRMQGAARELYPALKEIFRRVVELGISQSRISFRGTFAKLDYIIKENQIPWKTAQQIHTTRKVLEQTGSKSETELNESFRHDVKSVALLLSSLPGQAPVPNSLLMLLPEDDRVTKWGSVDLHLIRCVVDEWDEDYIFATEDQQVSRLKICYNQHNKYLTRDGQGDWSYLRTLLSPGCILNLVRVRMDNGVCMPELIIYEPDYLINITTVASCFETYDESPWVNLINKLKPQANSAPILLGNLAGQYLDDTIHNRKIGTADSYVDFLRKNALEIATCPDFGCTEREEKFKNDASQQLTNIHNLIGLDLPKTFKDYSPEKVVLEPSFFSKVLGLQGRMDFFFKDSSGKSIIIEQKSGKCGDFRIAFNQTPVAKETHWVQLILYRALLTYEFQHFDSQQQVLLLYSKYSQGLIAPGLSPSLLLRAFELRNKLAWTEITYAEEGFGILNRLTPETLNRKGAQGALWTGWTRPALDNILSPIHNASPVERAYFLRFLQFVQKENVLAKIGNRINEDSGFAGKWLDSRDAKIAAGNLYDRLTLTSFHTQDGAVDQLRLDFPERQNADTSNFRKGDIIILYPYIEGHEPDACAQMVTRGSLSKIDANGVEVTLTFPQTNPKVFDRPEGYYWAIEHDMFESSNNRLFGALHSMLTAPQSQRDLFLCQRKPSVDHSFAIKGNYGNFNELVSRAKQARELFLIIGPPGTGKTSFGMLNLLKEELLEPNTNILLLSYTNRAVDEICSKLAEVGIDFVRIGSPLSCDKRYHDNLLGTRVSQLNTEQEVRELVARTRVFCATTTTMNSHTSLFSIKNFNLAIVDESSQILEPHLVGLWSACYGAQPAISRWVLIGDHKQLPAVVLQSAEESLVTSPELHAIHLTNCRLSLFERLLASFKTNDGYDPQYVYMLRHQGRMHQTIAEFASQEFYGNQLQVVPLPHQTLPCQPSNQNGIAQLLTSRRIAFVASDQHQEISQAKSNPIEAEMIAQTVVEIYKLNSETFNPDQTVGVIVPYRNQIATIRNAISQHGIEQLYDISIDTVERFQGSQRDYIIYGFTVTEPYQLSFLANNSFCEDGKIIDRKLNVALTRAKLHLLLIGNDKILYANSVFRNLIDFLRQKDSFFAIGKDDYCQGKFSI